MIIVGDTRTCTVTINQLNSISLVLSSVLNNFNIIVLLGLIKTVLLFDGNRQVLRYNT